LFFHGQHRRSCLPRAGWEVGDRGPLLPFGNGLLVDPVAFSQHPQALLTMLYRSTHRLCRRGAPMKNLAHSASFHTEDKDAPSNPGIKHRGHLKEPCVLMDGFPDRSPGSTVGLPARSAIVPTWTSPGSRRTVSVGSSVRRERDASTMDLGR